MGPHHLEVIAALNAGGAAVAAVANAWAAANTSRWLRALFASISSLAGVYVAAFIWLTTHIERGQRWSEVMRPLGLASWILAWAAEPVVLVLWLRRQAREIECRAHQKLEEISGEYPEVNL